MGIKYKDPLSPYADETVTGTPSFDECNWKTQDFLGEAYPGTDIDDPLEPELEQ